MRKGVGTLCSQGEVPQRLLVQQCWVYIVRVEIPYPAGAPMRCQPSVESLFKIAAILDVKHVGILD